MNRRWGLDATLYDGHARKPNSQSSKKKGSVCSDHYRKPHTVSLEEFEARCSSFDYLTTFFAEGLQYGTEVTRPRRWSSRPSSSGSRPGSPSVSEAALVESDLVSVRRRKEISSGSSRTGNEQVLRIEQPTARRGRRPTVRAPPAVFSLEALDASARHPLDQTRPPLHPPLAPTAATPRLRSKYQSPGNHIGETVRRRAPRGQIIDCGCVEDQRMSGWSR